MTEGKRELQHLNDASRLLDAMRAWHPSIVCYDTTAQTDAEHDRHLLAQALAAAELAGKESGQAWVDCKERLPADVKVLAYHQDWGVACGTLISEAVSGDWAGYEHATHWMPLPPPPSKPEGGE